MLANHANHPFKQKNQFDFFMIRLKIAHLNKKLKYFFVSASHCIQTQDLKTSTQMSSIARVTEPSIYIHRVFHTVTQKRVFDVFSDLFGFDAIDRIDMVNKFAPSGEEYKRVFVHFRNWPNTTESRIVRDRLINGEKVKIVYDEPWFWLCAASNLPRPDAVNHEPKRPYIDIAAVNQEYKQQSRYNMPQNLLFTPPKKQLGNMAAAIRTPGAPRKRLDYQQPQEHQFFDNKTTDTYDDVMGRAMDARQKTTKTKEEEDAHTREMLDICKRLIDETTPAPKKYC